MELIDFSSPLQKLQNFNSEVKLTSAVSLPLRSLRKAHSPSSVPSDCQSDAKSKTSEPSRLLARGRDRERGGDPSDNENENCRQSSGEVAYGEVNSGTNLGGRRESSAASGILSTWGLTNALMSPVTSQSDDKYVCPNDRQLSLRAKLGTGWSMRTHKRSRSSQPFSFTRRFSSRYNSRPDKRRSSTFNSPDAASATHDDHFGFDGGFGEPIGRPPSSCGGGGGASYESNISEGEMAAIQSVLKRADQITTMEQQRIGKMITQLQYMKDQTVISPSPTYFNKNSNKNNNKSFSFQLPINTTNDQFRSPSSPSLVGTKLASGSVASILSDTESLQDLVEHQQQSPTICEVQTRITPAAVPNSNECGFCGAELDKSAADLMSQSFNQLTSVLFSSVDSGRNSAGGGGSVFNRGSVCSDCHKRACSRCIVKVVMPKVPPHTNDNSPSGNNNALLSPTAASGGSSSHGGGGGLGSGGGSLLSPGNSRISPASMMSSAFSSSTITLHVCKLCAHQREQLAILVSVEVMEKLLLHDTSDTSDIEYPLPSPGQAGTDSRGHRSSVTTKKSPARKSLNEITNPGMIGHHQLITIQPDGTILGK
ncbi:uncharacterized protein LOC134851936 [Symsagittifera roscoffensis]|uniref:uncharacterized protein LOC134851936 n=1 Tax=Symsagittifera roscoffensis TaxID=84072 RepID=UPI00307B4726